MHEITNKKWWKAAGIRALKTVAQTAVATIGTAALIDEVNWVLVVSAAALAGVMSLLTSIGGLPEVKEESNGN
jgi:zinc transporter ZupT